jgi:hypothetical protein
LALCVLVPFSTRPPLTTLAGNCSRVCQRWTLASLARRTRIDTPADSNERAKFQCTYVGDHRSETET